MRRRELMRIALLAASGLLCGFSLIADSPAADRPKVPGLDVSGFSFNGQTMQLADGTYMATLYGRFVQPEDYSYDRVPNSWQRIPEDMDDTNSVWLVRVTVERTAG